MPNKRNAIKALRQGEKKYVYNLRFKRQIKDVIKKARQAIKTEPDKAAQIIKQAVVLLDKAAQKGVLKKNNSARRKSRLWSAFKSVNQAKQGK